MSNKDKLNKEDKEILERKKRLEISESFLDSDPENRDLVMDTLLTNYRFNNIKILLKDKREKLLHKMTNSNCSIAINMISKKVITVSKSSNRKQYEFDIDRFKKEHPKLYKNYLVPSRDFSSGGRLTIRDISDKDYEIYKSIIEDYES